MRNQIVMKTGIFATPQPSVTMCAFRMTCVIERFGNITPLQGKIIVGIKRCTFIDTPAHGAMIDNNIILISAPNGIAFIGEYFVAQSETHETDNHITCTDLHFIITQANAITRSCLTCNRYISLRYIQSAFKDNNTRNFKKNGPRTGLIQSPSECSHRTIIGQ
ncbi:hypothetical protein SDC9_109613 [bioreactor metagenome]|uniref:Uncharacterized protein n=1 Tax=bioreactor metagenome TaxID=1076179 RepID=A0A645BCB7_9ZZZZ